MFGDLTLQMIFILVFGVAVFVLGTASLRNYLRLRRPGALPSGRVVNVNHIEKRNDQGYLIQYYYELAVQYTEGGRGVTKKIKSTREYQKGDQVRIGQNGREPVVWDEDRSLSPVASCCIILAGIGLVLMPYAQQRSEQEASLILALLLILAGGCLTATFLKDRRRSLTAVQGEIVDLLYYKTAEGKRFTKAVETYYPIIRCAVDGKERSFRSKCNSSRASAYPKGKTVTLYCDATTGEIVEKRAGAGYVIGAAACWALAVIGIVSLLV